MENGADQQTIEMLDTFSNDAPSTFFEHEPTQDTTTVREMYFALRSIVNQLRTPINTDTEALTKWLVYKQSGPHRHQKFFGFFRQMNRCVKKYNDVALVKKLNHVLKKTANSGNTMYKLEPALVQYMGCAFVKRVYMLERIYETCMKCADGAIGLLELEHWSNLCLVVVSLCSQVHSDIVTHLIEIEKVYNSSADVFRNVDKRFPVLLNDLKVVQKMKKKSKLFEDLDLERQTDIKQLSAISRLLKFSTERIVEAQAENKLKMRTSGILYEPSTGDIKSNSENGIIKMNLDPDQSKNSKMKLDNTIDEMSLMNSTGQSGSMTSLLEYNEFVQDDILVSPSLFGSSKKQKKCVSVKRPSTATPYDLISKKSKKKSKASFLTSTLSLFDSGDEVKKRGKN